MILNGHIYLKRRCQEYDLNHFLRVDFYNVNGKIYFGELTFYPASGLGKWTNKEADVKIGKYLEL